MSTESPKNPQEYEFLFLSEDEKVAKTSSLISSGELTLEDYHKNKAIFAWAARNTWSSISGEYVGIGKKIDTKLQDLLAQDVINIDFFLGYLKDNADAIRDPQSFGSIKSEQDMLSCSDIPDGIYRINIFNVDRYNERLNTLSDTEAKLWKEWCLEQPHDEGIIYHPVTDNASRLLGIKIFYQGHRNRCHIRTVTLEEIRSNIETGKKISVDDYKML